MGAFPDHFAIPKPRKSVPKPPLIAGAGTAQDLIAYFAGQRQTRTPANNAEIVGAFERRARAHRAIDALPETEGLRPSDEESDLWWIIGEQERIIIGGAATTPAAIAAKIWVATHMAANAPPDGVDGVALDRALTDGDLDTLSAMAEFLDTPMQFALSALASLKIMEASR